MLRAIVVAVSVVLAGCGAGGEDLSAECMESMRAAAAERDPERADPLIAATLDACRTAEEWLAALGEYPAAMGLTEQATIDEATLEVPCWYSPETVVCRDAGQ